MRRNETSNYLFVKTWLMINDASWIQWEVFYLHNSLNGFVSNHISVVNLIIPSNVCFLLYSVVTTYNVAQIINDASAHAWNSASGGGRKALIIYLGGTCVGKYETRVCLGPAGRLYFNYLSIGRIFPAFWEEISFRRPV